MSIFILIQLCLADSTDLTLENEDFVEQAFANEVGALNLNHWQDSHQWESLRLHRPLLTITSTWNDRLLAMDDLGQIFLFGVSGGWDLVYSKDQTVVNVEDLLLNLESSLSEQWDEVDEDVQYEDDTEEVVEPDSLNNEWEMAIDDPLLKEELQDRTSTLWASDNSELALSCYGNGCQRSVNNGYSWVEIEELPPALDFAEYQGLILAATPHGLWVSEDRGVNWYFGNALPKDQVFFEIHAQNDDFLIVGGQKGIWTSIDGKHWKKMPARNFEQAAFKQVVVGADNFIWAISNEGLLLSKDLGNRFELINEQEFSILMEDPINHSLLALSDDGVFESVDGGYTWQSLDQKLPVVHGTGLTQWRSSFALSTDQGAFHLALASEDQDSLTEEMMLSQEEFQQLLISGTMEIDQQLNDLQIERSTQLLRWVPTLSVNYDYGFDRMIAANLDSISTIGNTQVPWKVMTNLCFGLCQSSSTDVGFSNLADDVMVIGDSVYRSDIGGVVPAAGNVSMELQKMRQKRTQRIIDLYSSTLRLSAEQGRIAKSSLSNQVLHQIEILEVAAMLDLYTDGHYSVVIQKEENK